LCGACTNADSKGKKRGECESPRKVKRSIFDLAHRAADAVVQSSPGLSDLIAKAFKSLQDGDAGPLCVLAPTSLVFGVWDSRGESGEKRPRLVRSTIRAWDVEPLHAAAQFNSVWKTLDREKQQELEKVAKGKEAKLSSAGFNDAPATFRKVSTTASRHMTEFRNGSPNPERRVLGGVIAKGPIERNVTVNLVALRGLQGTNPVETAAIRKYLLGLSLMAATQDIELFLREGCHLRYANKEDVWSEVPRRGEPGSVKMPTDLRSYTVAAGNHFRSKWPQETEYIFNLSEAKKLIAKSPEEGEKEEAAKEQR